MDVHMTLLEVLGSCDNLHQWSIIQHDNGSDHDLIRDIVAVFPLLLVMILFSHLL